MNSKLLSVTQAAELANISRVSMYRMVNDGRIPCIRIGKLIRIKPEVIGVLVQIQDQASGSAADLKKPVDPLKEQTFFDRLRPELEKAFSDIPSFGEVGFRLLLHDSQVVRIEYAFSKSVKIEPSNTPKGPVQMQKNRYRG